MLKLLFFVILSPSPKLVSLKTEMTTVNQSRYWAHSKQYSKQTPWNEYQKSCNPENSHFINLKRSKKGTRLNIPDEFYRRPVSEKSFVGQIPVLPVGGCSDMDYVLYRQNMFREMMAREEIYYNKQLQYTPSVTINIGTPPINQSGVYQQCQRRWSYSTVSINPTVVSEEPWVTKKNVVPLGLYCCGERGFCEHTVSEKQQQINLEGNFKDERFVYVTTPPKISPLKFCWKFLLCKRKKKQDEVYLPTAMIKQETKNECDVCQKCPEAVGESTTSNCGEREKCVASRLSTITESLITISEFSSEEFIGNDDKKKHPGKMETSQYPRTYTGTGRALKGVKPSFSSRSEMYSPSFGPQGTVYRWVCEPSYKGKGLLGKNNKEYICYKDF